MLKRSSMHTMVSYRKYEEQVNAYPSFASLTAYAAEMGSARTTYQATLDTRMTTGIF